MLHLEYESCVAHLRTCVSRVLTFLDVDRSSEVVRKLVGVEDYTQNPLSMRDRIANFDEVVTALDQAGLTDFVLEESFSPTTVSQHGGGRGSLFGPSEGHQKREPGYESWFGLIRFECRRQVGKRCFTLP